MAKLATNNTHIACSDCLNTCSSRNPTEATVTVSVTDVLSSCHTTLAPDAMYTDVTFEFSAVPASSLPLCGPSLPLNSLAKLRH
jgi:hypothetical protein